MYVSKHLVIALINAEEVPGVDELASVIGNRIASWSEDTTFRQCDITGDYTECYQLLELISGE